MYLSTFAPQSQRGRVDAKGSLARASRVQFLAPSQLSAIMYVVHAYHKNIICMLLCTYSAYSAF
jgi:hypothetical protein